MYSSADVLAYLQPGLGESFARFRFPRSVREAIPDVVSSVVWLDDGRSECIGSVSCAHGISAEHVAK